MSEANSFEVIRSFDFAIQTSDAYSYDRYGNGEWVKCIIFLKEEGYTREEIDWILRHKHMRWAGDEYGATCKGFQQYYKHIKHTLRQSLNGLFPKSEVTS